MEIYQTTFSGFKVNIVFNGACYLFHNPYFGFFAFAEREIGTEHFTIKYGNHHCTGGSFTPSVIRSKVEGFIKKNEGKYIPQSVTIDWTECDLANAYLSMTDGFVIR